MNINPLLSVISSALSQQAASGPARTSAVPSSSIQSPPAASSDSAPPQTVVQSASLINAASSLAQLSSLLEVTQSGTQRIGSVLEQLQALAQQAGSADNADLPELDSAFQQLLAELDRTVSGTRFNGTQLLSGALSAGADGEEQAFSLPDLSLSSLFGGKLPNLSSPSDTAEALRRLPAAQTSASNAQSALDSFFGQLGVASASVDSAFANSAAASSTLQESDLNGPAENDFAAFLSNPSLVRAQTGNIPSGLLSLLQE